MFLLIWKALRTVMRLALAALFAASVVAVMVMAWLGWVDAFRAEVALAVMAFSVLIRFNLFALMGCFFYGESVLNLPVATATLYVLPSLAILFPGPLFDVFNALRRPADGRFE